MGRNGVTPEELASASQLLDLLRKKGARSFKGFGVELELGPIEAKEAATPAVVDTARCSCGHMDYEHGAGLCLQGCDPLSCVKGKT